MSNSPQPRSKRPDGGMLPQGWQPPRDPVTGGLMVTDDPELFSLAEGGTAFPPSDGSDEPLTMQYLLHSRGSGATIQIVVEGWNEEKRLLVAKLREIVTALQGGLELSAGERYVGYPPDVAHRPRRRWTQRYTPLMSIRRYLQTHSAVSLQEIAETFYYDPYTAQGEAARRRALTNAKIAVNKGQRQGLFAARYDRRARKLVFHPDDPFIGEYSLNPDGLDSQH